MFGFDVGGFVMGTVILSLLIPIVIVVVVLVTVVWAVRRSTPSGRDVAIQELRARFAAGQIDQAEFEARMDALTRRT